MPSKIQFHLSCGIFQHTRPHWQQARPFSVVLDTQRLKPIIITSIVVIIVLLISACYFWKSRRQIILEGTGIIIGIVSGVCISYLTDANFQANVNGPFFKLVHNFNKSVKYINIAWTNISAEKVKGDKYNIRATNTTELSISNAYITMVNQTPRYRIVKGAVNFEPFQQAREGVV